ncbi:MAG: hypothetical protein ACXVQJ_01970 [Actinomycetota bacterium]
MGTGRRLATLLVILGVIGAPAVAMRAFCLGNSCDSAQAGTSTIPFCGLPADIRTLVTAGFYDARSPDAIGVTGASSLVTPIGDGLAVPWPSTAATPASMAVPLAIVGPQIRTQRLHGAGLDRIAPTVTPLLGIRRPHPEVRSGTALPGVVVPGARSPLVVTIVWKGVGMPEVGASWGRDARALAPSGSGAAVGTGTPGSLPLDPTTVLTTIGTGGLPSDHGVVGTFVRTDKGIVRSFGPGAPEPVIASLGDDLDELTGGAAKIALVETDVSDRGLIGGAWYGGRDEDTVIAERHDPAGAVARLLGEGFGAGGPSDLLGVTMTGSVGQMDARTRAIAREVFAAVPDATVVVTATGSLAASGHPIVASSGFLHGIDVAALPSGGTPIAAAGTSGLFLDDAVITQTGVTTQQVVDAMKVKGGSAFADAFPSFVVQFGRYC